MTPRVAVVTGANRGIGLATVKGLALGGHPDLIVYLTARNAVEGIRAANELMAEHRIRVHFHRLDIDDPESVILLRAEMGKNFIHTIEKKV